MKQVILPKISITEIVRLILTCFMIYKIYHEAGLYTAIFASLVSIYIELKEASE